MGYTTCLVTFDVYEPGKVLLSYNVYDYGHLPGYPIAEWDIRDQVPVVYNVERQSYKTLVGYNVYGVAYSRVPVVFDVVATSYERAIVEFNVQGLTQVDVQFNVQPRGFAVIPVQFSVVDVLYARALIEYDVSYDPNRVFVYYSISGERRRSIPIVYYVNTGVKYTGVAVAAQLVNGSSFSVGSLELIVKMVVGGETIGGGYCAMELPTQSSVRMIITGIPVEYFGASVDWQIYANNDLVATQSKLGASAVEVTV